MLKRVMTEKWVEAKMMDDEYEIPHGTSNNFHHQSYYHYFQRQYGGDHQVYVNGSSRFYDDNCSHPSASPISGFSLQSDGSSISLFSAGHSLSEDGSSSTPPLEEFKSQIPFGSFSNLNGILLDSKNERPVDSPLWMEANQSWIDELGLDRSFSSIYIGNEKEDASIAERVFPDKNGLKFYDPSSQRCENYDNMRTALPGCMPVSRTASKFDGEITMVMHQDHGNGNSSDSVISPGCPVSIEQGSKFCNNGLGRHPATQFPSYAQSNEMNFYKTRSSFDLTNSLQWTGQKSLLNAEYITYCGQPEYVGRTRAASGNRIPQDGLLGFTHEDNFIIRGEGLNYGTNNRALHPEGRNRGTLNETGESRLLNRRLLVDGRSPNFRTHENVMGARIFNPYSQLIKSNSWASLHGCINFLAKDQHGCRFLQKIFDEGTPEDKHLIFTEVIDHLVELIINPFGNYLMQKLLDKCTEEERMKIILILTEEPGQLVKISFNSHGTRVVQKLIETLKTRRQISLVVSALEPGFLALIKDSNGNHVVQHCLQWLSNDSIKFIFVAAAKYCIDIATHRHGCCVLQRCIDHSTGNNRENLVTGISNNGLLLSQDPYGNYVVQFVLDLKIPSTNACLSYQFEGNYLHLSTQKFASHVVEKCLRVFKGEARARIIRELISAPHFERLLKDPHANYVVQTALQVSQGLMHNSLVRAIESHKAMSRNSPYSKWIFSHKFTKK